MMHIIIELKQLNSIILKIYSNMSRVFNVDFQAKHYLLICRILRLLFGLLPFFELEIQLSAKYTLYRVLLKIHL